MSLIRRISISASLLLLTASASAFASFPIKSYKATFALNHHGKHVGESVKVFKTDGKHYTFSGDTKVHVLFIHKEMREASSGAVSSHGIQPKHYQTSQGLSMAISEFPVAKGLQDNLTQQLMMRFNLIKTGVPGSMTAVTAKGKQKFNFSLVKDNVSVNSPLGKLATTEVTYTDKKGNTVAEWLAKKYNYLPAVILISKGGDISDSIYLTKFSG